MPEQTLRRRALCISLVLGAALCAAVYLLYAPTGAFLAGSALGGGCAALSLWLFFLTWGAAPDKGRVGLLYGLRLAVVFGSILLAMFVPFLDALGVLLPQMFPIPVVAVLTLRGDTPKGGPK